MNDIKGTISLPENEYEKTINLTCCEHRPNILIDGKELYDLLKESGGLGSLPTQEETPCESAKHVEWQIRYCVRDEPFKADDDFEAVAAEIQEYALNTEEVRGCYSEMTCGTGDYDFVLKGSHSLLTELASFEGKHVWLRLSNPVEVKAEGTP